jgi:hypothetical protein
MKYTCVIAPVGKPKEESTVEIEAEHKGEALVVSSRLHPGTYVKTIEEIVIE